MKNHRVLIADANDRWRAVYRESLPRHDLRVATAKDPGRCVDRLIDFQPDLLVMDPELGREGGEGVLTLMHEQNDIPVVPVFILYNGDDFAQLNRIFRFPIHDFELKPVEPSRLARRIHQLLDSGAPPGAYATWRQSEPPVAAGSFDNAERISPGAAVDSESSEFLI